MSPDSPRLLTGRVALVTGACSGLGLATCRSFAEHGAAVVAVDLAGDGCALQPLIEDGHAVTYAHADVKVRSDLAHAVGLAESSYGRLDTVVANAGILGRASFRATDEVTDDEWAEVIEVNLGGVYRTFATAIPALRRAGGGSLAATSSVSGSFASLYRAAYSASKGGINALVRSLSVELAPDRIRVNAVSPGGMSTNINASLRKDERTDALPERPSKEWKARILWPERDRTVDTARIHVFLASELAMYISGETLIADGGFSIWNGT